MATKNSELKVVHTERTEEEIIEALGEFATASYESVGVNNTYETIKFLTKIINDSPGTYKKIFHPKTLEKLTKLGEGAKGGGSLSTMEMIGIVGEIGSILR
ncbi:hypothetical protein [Dyadobacter bucti]|uniref:hypothetical protein n=1 Tax=Dyadobacter bucti TaxID=2572203 RepID=UPI003F71AD29